MSDYFEIGDVLIVTISILILALSLRIQVSRCSLSRDVYFVLTMHDVRKPNKLTLPFYFGIVGLGNALIKVFDNYQSEITTLEFLSSVLLAFLLGLSFLVVILLKGYLSILVLGITFIAVILGVYYNLPYDMLELFSKSLKMVMGEISIWHQIVYTIVILLITFKNSLWIS